VASSPLYIKFLATSFKAKEAQCGNKVESLLLAGNYMRQHRTAKDSTAWNERGNKECRNVDKIGGQKNEKRGKLRGRNSQKRRQERNRLERIYKK
jgi:hypothetical protein